MHVKYAVLHFSYSAPVRVSDMFTGVCGAAARDMTGVWLAVRLVVVLRAGVAGVVVAAPVRGETVWVPPRATAARDAVDFCVAVRASATVRVPAARSVFTVVDVTRWDVVAFF